jgi:glycosyltransferase involved in cell wall biosynthesis
VPALLRAADAFVFPSLWEGAANALVEAMALGVPSAVTDDPALREIAGEDAVYFAPKDSRAITTALAGIVANPDIARARAAAAVPRLRRTHDLARNTRGLEELYDRLLAIRMPGGNATSS